jgi:hypothetical protein
VGETASLFHPYATAAAALFKVKTKTIHNILMFRQNIAQLPQLHLMAMDPTIT